MSLGGLFGGFGGGGGFNNLGLINQLITAFEVLAMAAVICTAILVYRGMVKGKPVSAGGILGVGIAGLVVFGVLLILNVVYQVMLVQIYEGLYIASQTLAELFHLLALVGSGVLLLASGKRPGLARGALLLQTVAVLELWLTRFCSLFSTLMAPYEATLPVAWYLKFVVNFAAMAVSLVVCLAAFRRNKQAVTQ